MGSSTGQTQTEPPAALTEPTADIEAYLSARVADLSLPAHLRSAIEYAVMGGGKRLRPVLAIHCCEAVGGPREVAMPAAAALELVHTFSLVHDDLPAMDNDDLRRGRPTLHRHTNEAMAILAGDAMLTGAFDLLGRSVAEQALAGRLTGELSHAALKMIAGQVYDTLAEDEEQPPTQPMERLKRIHWHKTAALLRGACRMGAISGGADEKALAAISDYGEAIGVMFQAVDDLLDVTQSTEALGKAAGKDAEQGKLTYPGLLGVEGTQEQIDRLREQAQAALDDLGEPAKPLSELCDFLAVRQR
jgi:geranylgeranyl diphosphate synthase type II